MSKEMSVEIAMRIAFEEDCDQVIVWAWNKARWEQNIITYGKSVTDSDQAAQGGNCIKAKLLGWPQSEALAIPDRVRQMRKALAFYATTEHGQMATDLLRKLFSEPEEKEEA